MAKRKRKRSKAKRKRKSTRTAATTTRKRKKRRGTKKSTARRTHRRKGGARKSTATRKHRGRKPRRKRKGRPYHGSALERYNIIKMKRKAWHTLSPVEKARARHSRKRGRKHPHTVASVPSGFTAHQTGYLAELRARAAARKAAAGGAHVMAL